MKKAFLAILGLCRGHTLLVTLVAFISLAVISIGSAVAMTHGEKRVEIIGAAELAVGYNLVAAKDSTREVNCLAMWCTAAEENILNDIISANQEIKSEAAGMMTAFTTFRIVTFQDIISAIDQAREEVTDMMTIFPTFPIENSIGQTANTFENIGMNSTLTLGKIIALGIDEAITRLVASSVIRDETKGLTLATIVSSLSSGNMTRAYSAVKVKDASSYRYLVASDTNTDAICWSHGFPLRL